METSIVNLRVPAVDGGYIHLDNQDYATMTLEDGTLYLVFWTLVNI